jgi:tetratricopeptide (TPR) repeat protein
MPHQLKSISKAGIPEALAKVELYRYLNEPEEAESICRDILAVDPEHQLAKRMLGLAITDQFAGVAADRYAEVHGIFQSLRDAYEKHYYTGLLLERRAKAQLHAGCSPHILLPLIEEAMRHFSEAEKIRPASNDDSILRWNRCARLLESRPEFHAQHPGPHELHAEDAPPVNIPTRRIAGHR